MSTALLELRDLHVAAGRGDGAPEILRGVSFAVDRGRRLGLVGESGCGKSMTALAIMGLLRRPLHASAGEILLDGTDLRALSEKAMNRVRGGRIGMVYQDPMSALNPVHTIGRQIMEAILLHSDLTRAQARERAADLLGEVGVPEPRRRLDAYPHEFSGGMRQRVVIAMALSAEPDLVIADEPTTALDVTTQARILDLLAGLAEDRGAAMILITHDLGVAAGFCDAVQVMYAGRIVERTAVDDLYARPLHPYSEALLGAACDLTMDVDAPIPAIGGRPPLPGELEGVCSFHPRCAYARDVCRETRPQLRDLGGVLVACHVAEERLAAASRAPGRARVHG